MVLHTGAANRLGKIKTINVAGKGYGIVDNIRLLNSKNNKPILSEDFNGDGVSHTIFLLVFLCKAFTN